MPQYKRKVAFSNKKKKEQIQASRNRKRIQQIEKNEPLASQKLLQYNYEPSPVKLCDKIKNPTEKLVDRSSVFQNEVVGLAGPSNAGRNRYQLKFKKISAEEKLIQQRLHHTEMKYLGDMTLEIGSDIFYPEGLDYPKRPNWNAKMSRSELDQSENRSFRLFCEDLDTKFMEQNLCKYEMNLETWRQLWRVTEISDILLIIVDARYPALQFPPYLYDDIVKIKKKNVILVMNKCDLLPSSLVLAWKKYFTEKFPDLIVVPFYSLEGKRTPRGLLRLAAQSSLKLISACEDIIKSSTAKVDLSSWRDKIEHDDSGTSEVVEESSSKLENYTKFNNGVLTLGTIGHPNVGKSSLINALMGKTVVSVSKTPGHTKHFQTIFLTKSVKLCDCPGLVFPSICPVELQVVTGSYPIAQYHDPLGVLHYIGTMINLPTILKLDSKLLVDYDTSYSSKKKEIKWTSFNVAESWAIKRNYVVKVKGAKPDVHRASNELLRLTLSGHKNLIVNMKPPNYSINKDTLIESEEIKDIEFIQGLLQPIESEDSSHEEDNSDNESEEEEDEQIQTCSFNKFALLNEDSEEDIDEDSNSD